MNAKTTAKAPKSTSSAAPPSNLMLRKGIKRQGSDAVSGTGTNAPSSLQCDFSRIHVRSDSQSLPIQAKLRIGAPDDRYEREADQIAEQVMRMPELAVQRKCAACAAGEDLWPKCAEEEAEKVHRKPLTAAITPLVQRRVADGSGSEAPLIVHEVLRSPGRPLDPYTRQFMESRFGHDFSRVQVHTDQRAAALSRALNAQAFTHADHIVFGSGQFNPHSMAGRHLLAHELTHVVQQRAGKGRGMVRVPFIQTREEESSSSPWSGRMPRAEEIFRNAPRVRPLNDGNFWNIFYDRNKVIVVDFWSTSCRPCDRVARHIASLADRYASGPYAEVVKFYQAEWDPAVNPMIFRRYGFQGIPVVYFYHTTTGRQPAADAPLLEGSLAGIVPESEYIWRIDHILRRHGHGADGSAGPAVPGDRITRKTDDERASTVLGGDSSYPSRVAGIMDRWGSLATRYGQVTCLPPFADVSHEIRLANCDQGCTRPATQVHERTHVHDIADCCLRWRAAARRVFSSGAVNPRAARRLYLRWLDWIEANSHYLESRAYWNMLIELRRLQSAHRCSATGPSRSACCSRIARWIGEATTIQRTHHRASSSLTSCPWAAVTGGGSPSVTEVDTCHGVGHLSFRNRDAEFPGPLSPTVSGAEESGQVAEGPVPPGGGAGSPTPATPRCIQPNSVRLVRSYALTFPGYLTGGGICAVMEALPRRNLCTTGIHEQVTLASGATCPSGLLRPSLCSGSSMFTLGRNQVQICRSLTIPATGFVDRHSVQLRGTSVLHDRGRNPRNLARCAFTCNQRYFLRIGERERTVGRFQIHYRLAKGRRNGDNITVVTATKRPRGRG